MKKPDRKILFVAVTVVALAIISTMLYGQGYLNQGSLRLKTPVKKVARVAQTTCKEGSLQEANLCVYTLAPVEYGVYKEESDYLIVLRTGDGILTENAIRLAEGDSVAGTMFSPANRTMPFTPLTLSFKYTNLDGETLPAFVLKGSTAESFVSPRFVEVDLPKNVRIRFDTFYLP